MDNRNPYTNLFLKLRTQVENPQAEFVRVRFLEIFMQVVESNPIMNFSALNYFSLAELNVIKICMRKTFNEFIMFFTPENFLKHKKSLGFFIRKIKERGSRVRLRSKLMMHQFPRLKTAILIKLKKMQGWRKIPRCTDPYAYLRLWLHDTGLGKYFKWCQKVGNKFSNRVEVDFSGIFCLRLINGDVD